MNREGKKCVLYPRVSTEMQVDGYSLEGQKNSLKRFADREEMEIVGIYEDAGKSGKSIEGRPAFKKMLSDIKNGLEIDYILVYKLSRFGRNAADILNSLEFVQSYGINLICIEEGIATVYKGNIIKNLIMDCQSYTKYRPNETTGGIFVSWRRKEELPTGA